MNTLRLARAAVGLLAVALALGVSSANAALPSESLTSFGSSGSGAGQLKAPSVVSAGPRDGHVFVVERDNARISEFTPWGSFVKAFGWDVAPGAVNEQQEVTIKATAGQFRLSFEGSSTGDLERGAAPTEVAAALNALPSISGGGVSVAGGASDAASTRYVVSFSGGALAAMNVAAMTASNGSVPLGGTPSASAAVATRADGTPGGTGLESCTAESGCKAGIEGSGAGQLQSPTALAVGDDGIYLREAFGSQRIQKFDSSGRFVWMAGGEVDKTSGADLCTAASGHLCGAPVAGTGPGELSGGQGLAINPAGNIIAADANRFQELDPAGAFVAAIATPGNSADDIAIDPRNGDIYANFAGTKSVTKLTAAGAALCGFELPAFDPGYPGYPAPTPHQIAVDSNGDVYVSTQINVSYPSDHLYRVTDSCPTAPTLEFSLEHITDQHIRGLATNAIGDLLLTRAGGGADYVQVFGPPPVNFEPPPQVAPSIVAQYASAVSPKDATLRAEINPRFWTDTRYYIEYGTGKCSEGGCDRVEPAPPGAILSKAVSGATLSTKGVLLSGLQAGTTYHYRFVAQSGGGGPVRGIEGGVGADGEENSFRTPALPSPSAGCPNQTFRTGPSATLPNCRAYEMVSPVDKNNGDIYTPLNISSNTSTLYKSSRDGERFTYTSSRAFPGSVGGAIPNQYLAARGAAGWSSQSLSPPREIIGGGGNGQGNLFFENEYQGFTEDLTKGWLLLGSATPLASGPPPGSSVLFGRDNGTGSYEALAFAANTLPSRELALQGYSADGSAAIFQVANQLTPEAAAGVQQLYYAEGGQLQLVCILPNGSPSGKDCSAGSPPFASGASGASIRTRFATLTHAISEDGSHVYWTAAVSGPDPTKPGKIYLRLNPGQPQSPLDGEGNCEDPSAACTLAVTTKAAQFWAGSADGSKALYSFTEGVKAGELNVYDAGEETSTPVAGKVIGVAAQSEDLSRIYFVSAEALGGANSEGKSATAGQPNLYLAAGGTNTFIATLTNTDIRIPGNGNEGGPSNVAPQSIFHVPAATPAGDRLAFISSGSPTGYDNLDTASGLPDAEVYLYDARTAELLCASCNPSGARPTGRVLEENANQGGLRAAAIIPAPYSNLTRPRVISEDGSRLFFTAYDGLVAADTNGKADVYQWERAGTGDCQQSDRSYSPQNGGCIALISSGESPSDSLLIDSSPDGRDVFFTTNASLLVQDPGLVDVYDAREDGGFPAPATPTAACEGEACQGPLSPPNDPTPASLSFRGAGNVVEKPARKKQQKKKKSHKTKRKQAKKQAKKSGRAGR